MIETSLPSWLIRELEAYAAERRKGDITVRFDEGEVAGIVVGPEFRRPPPLPLGTRVSCPTCASAGDLIDMGRRIYCPKCRRTSVVEASGVRTA